MSVILQQVIVLYIFIFLCYDNIKNYIALKRGGDYHEIIGGSYVLFSAVL